MGKKRAEYDDDELVELIADGLLTYKAIGERLGISEGLVKKIAHGRRRADLARRLWEAEDGVIADARRAGVRFAKQLVREQLRLGLLGKGEPARRAREFVLKFVTAASPRRKEMPPQLDRRPEWLLKRARAIGVVPWEDQLDAERESEACEYLAPPPATEAGEPSPALGNAMLATTPPGMPAVASMATESLMPAGETVRG